MVCFSFILEFIGSLILKSKRDVASKSILMAVSMRGGGKKTK
jgi:hypothetical protein